MSDSAGRVRSCPTPCDDDCEAVCHEGHNVTCRKDHPDDWCQLGLKEREVINDLSRAAFARQEAPHV